MKTILKKSADPMRVEADLLAVGVAEPKDLPPGLAVLDAALGGAIARAADDGELSGKPGSATVFHAGQVLAAARVAVLGIGSAGTREDWESVGGALARKAREAGARKVAFLLPDGADAATARAVLLGAGLGDYRFDRFKKPPAKPEDAPTTIETLTLIGSGPKTADLTRAGAVVAAVNAARDLVNTPANHLTPTRLAARAQELADATPGLECELLEEKALRKLKAGALLAVGQGSVLPPLMIVMRYTPKRVARKGELLGLVGKAMTFDSGGISIKPASGMEEMKMDMGGGAAVIEGAGLVAALGLPVPYVAVVPSAENMPSGTAVKPGDVVTAMNGTTIEVINTDAEGRLILADGLTHAVGLGATRLLDLATLTGAIVVALGEVYAGLFGSDADWTEEVRLAGEETGDIVWPMPLHEGYAPLIESEIADLANASNKRQAGAVYAAQFLREFTAGRPWCHLDIAGTGMRSGKGTGFGVRLIAALAERLSRPG